jgi:flavin-dependent dehydrogenase
MKYDAIIVGGGLAGLSLSILMAKEGKEVLLIEKSSYPKHKVCGEYISNESLPFLNHIGVPIQDLNLPSIDEFVLTSQYGLSSSCRLTPGGFGISRYKLDALLAEIAIDAGVKLLQSTKVTEIASEGEIKIVKTSNGELYQSILVVGAFGRISGLQNTLSNEEEKYIGVKYHLDLGPAKNVIEIHNFKGGYCGISAIEDDKYCLCYLAKANALKAVDNDIERLESEVLAHNKFLAHRLRGEKIIPRVVTSQLSFGVSEANKDYLTIGDSAGFIPPITGNGMSLAFRGAKHTFDLIKKHSIKELPKASQAFTSKYLKSRINQGIFLQDILFIDSDILNKAIMYGLHYIPGALKMMSKKAVGKKF